MVESVCDDTLQIDDHRQWIGERSEQTQKTERGMKQMEAVNFRSIGKMNK